jgi:hypothetical protein
MIEETSVVGPVEVSLWDSEGNLKAFKKFNMVCDAGLALLAGRLIGTADPVTHMAVGTDATATAPTQTALLGEVARVAVETPTQVTTVVANDTAQFMATFGPGVGTGALHEAALLTADVGGTMLSRLTFGTVTKEAADTLGITWGIQFKREQP